ncbi:dual-specificity protein-like phosphatase 1 [Zea mays]|uniref:phosphatidylglycerophosphatase n=1 Tax=Zea mays TaxID=4577 RepID=B6T3N5_MAIZE|nr:dual-specificity protein-like phosphatase 1 [Zea mays]ACG31718.1 protein-tyrosine phosphatase mitochondrial 1 [Zea mays]ONM63143.1 Dual-specificity protein-like phosphatase 1 [Zea mays]|eukprot:NP_001345354.1 dual-specificity protein-like phosphatase 1 [Zea mays]
MLIEELPGDPGGGRGEGGEDELLLPRREDGDAAEGESGVVMRVAVDAKRAAVGVSARMLFYPTLVYNVVRNRFEKHFHWWDQIDEHVLLGAVPFPSDVLRLKTLGVCGVVTLNESYERLVPTSLYEAHGIENLVLPTRDYLYAPSFVNLCEAADFIHRNASCGKLTYVHCKAGRGRSTTVVICYLVQYKNMTPAEAYEHVRLRRPRVLLASAQWQAVQEFYQLTVKKTGRSTWLDNPLIKPPLFLATRKLVAFDDSAFVMVSESDLEGYNADALALNMGSRLWEISLIYRVQFASKTAFAGFSYLWLRCRACKEALPENLGRDSCSLEVDQLTTGHPCLLQGVVVNP